LTVEEDPDPSPAEPGQQTEQTEQAQPGRPGPFNRFGPLAPVLGVLVFLLVELWPETTVVAYPDDSAIHSEMVRFVTARMQSGHGSLAEWFPFLNLGSPVFLHYQSLPALVTGVAGLAIGANHAFAWSCYLLVALWPISVFVGARLMRLPPWAASVAACLAPFVVSAPGLGYEQGSYLWIGFGLWSQLWAMWALPLAWGLSWRAINEGRFIPGAIVLTGLTMCLHFMTGYLALAAPIVFVLVRPRPLRHGLTRLGLVLGGSLAVAAWAIVPLVSSGKYAAINEFLQHTSHANGFGARRALSWLAEGQLFDAGRLPVITVFVGAGLVACMIRCRRDAQARALLALLGLSLLLFFGRTTFGSLIRVVPGSADLFFRRFVMGVQLSGLFIAGLGAVAIARTATALAHRSASRLERFLRRPRVVPVRRASVMLAGVAILLPAGLQIQRYDTRNAADIAHQAAADRTSGAAIDALVARLRTLPPGRVYAGLPYENWGQHFLVGDTMVLQYLATQDVDEVGFTLRTSSLMSNPEAYFDQYVPGDYRAFGVRYLLLPSAAQPSVRADLVASRDGYSLWSVPGVSYVQVVDTIPGIALDRGDIGKQTAWFLRSPLPTEGLYPTVAYEGAPAARPTSDGRHLPVGPAGSVTSERADLPDGHLSATVRANRTSVVLLSASYDPGWTATVDGRPAPTAMVAPALVGVRVGPGVHTVTFTYTGPRSETWLFAFSALALAGVVVLPGLGRRRQERSSRRRAG
jgi:hypothetical protein